MSWDMSNGEAHRIDEPTTEEMKLYTEDIEKLERRSNAIDKIITLLHQFNAECVKDPMEGYPLSRRARKVRYAEEIATLFD